MLFVFPPVSLSISSAPLEFIKNGSSQQVIEDTGTPSNNAPLPVKLTGATGDINITAGDLNVQLSDQGATPDVTRIGDGTNQLGMNADNEALVHDQDTHDKLDTLNSTDFATETTLSAVDTKIGTSNTSLATIAGKDFATQTTLAAVLAKIIASPATEVKQDNIVSELQDLLVELEKKADLTETQPVSIASMPLPTGGATEAKQDDAIAQLTSIAGEDFATQTTLAAILAKIIAAPSTEAKQDDVITELQAIKVLDFATETTLASLVSGSAKLEIKEVISPISIQSNNLPASASSPLEIVASTTATTRKIQTIEDIGQFIGLYTGAASSETLYCILPIAGGEVDVNIPSGTRLSIRNMKNSTVSDDVYFSANLMG